MGYEQQSVPTKGIFISSESPRNLRQGAEVNRDHFYVYSSMVSIYIQEEIVSLEPCTETADEVLVTDHEEETHNLSPPKALFLPSPNHPLHILVRHP